MSMIKRSAMVLAGLILTTTVAGANTTVEDATAMRPARVYVALPGQVLASRAPLTPPALLGEFLRRRGASEATARALRSVGEHDSPTSGMRHVRLQQEVAGVRVHNAYVKAAFTPSGDLVHVIENLSPVSPAPTLQSSIDEAEALDIVMRTLYPTRREQAFMHSREGNTTLFARHDFFHDAPRVERVLIPQGNVLAPGFLVETWTQQSNQLHETLVDGQGKVLAVERRSNTDRYKIFAEHPEHSSQTVAVGPGSGNNESPRGWLSSSAQNTVHITGNNVQAYLDTNANDRPDPGGSPVTDGRFLSTALLTASPTTPRNQRVAVQNLFYLTNLIHDTLYRHGFTETAGNFQEKNFGKGGRGGDALLAEVQDSITVDNASMTTPEDGRPPRMQVSLFRYNELVVDAPASIAGTFAVGTAEFGPPLTPQGFTGDVVLVEDGVDTSTDACEAVTTAVAGKIALIDRGNCLFTVKVKNAQEAGALGVIIANNAGDSPLSIGGEDSTIIISAVSVGQTDGQILRSVAGVHATAKTGSPPYRDSALDSDLVWHEYGHGLTWRMIGNMSGPIAGAIGEGMSDVLAIIINEDDVVGEYAAGHPVGIRRAPYRNYPRTYSAVTGAEEHDDGEVYGAIGWRLWEIFQRRGLSKDLLLNYLVDGMNYTPRRPMFEDMRDGLLEAVKQAGMGHSCLIWEAFAAYGVGLGANGRELASGRVVIKESFAMPPRCHP